MMSIEFMTGAVIFKLVYLLIALIVGYNVFAIARKLWFSELPEQLIWKSVLVNLVVITVMSLLMFFGNGASAPKISIDVPKNRDLIEYQSNQTTIQVEPVQPRYEVLDGFTPLKQ